MQVDAEFCDRLFFAGDDLNDEPVFESALPGWATVKVGPERPSSARFSLANRAQIGMVVDCILEALTTQPGVGYQSSANGV
jgi:trehalose 6-phosphate phosphatase